MQDKMRSSMLLLVVLEVHCASRLSLRDIEGLRIITDFVPRIINPINITILSNRVFDCPGR